MAMSYQIKIEPLGHTITVEDGQTILDASLREGIYLPHACGHGLCGTCKVRVVGGEFDHGEASPFALMDVEREEGLCLACCATPSGDMVIEADIDDDADARGLPLRDLEGTVTQIVDLTPTIKGVHIEICGEGLEFQAGQYVNLTLPGLEQPRAFSLSKPPQSKNRLELNVRHVAGGKGTTYIHEALKVGDTLKISGPLGRFFVRKSDPRPGIFLGGGSGLSSPRSMILDLLEGDGDKRPITLVYGARNRFELYYHELLLDLAARYENFRYFPVLSEPTPQCEWDGLSGLVHEAASSIFHDDFRSHKAYLCGPPAMIDACIRTLMRGRLFERDIYTEKFVTMGDGAKALARSPLFKHI